MAYHLPRLETTNIRLDLGQVEAEDVGHFDYKL